MCRYPVLLHHMPLLWRSSTELPGTVPVTGTGTLPQATNTSYFKYLHLQWHILRENINIKGSRRSD
jgi:hypothetical protein